MNKFSIVTPCLNSERHIKEAIGSVIEQKGNFLIDYVVVDGGSKDKTPEIVKECMRKNKNKNCRIRFIREKDQSMYEAINKGFKLTKGNLMAWVNSDDVYLANAFRVVDQIFKSRKIEWLTSPCSYINEKSKLFDENYPLGFLRSFIKKGFYGTYLHFINQTTCFWTKKLWQKSGGRVKDTFKLAGDFELWLRFSKKADLYLLENFSLAAFRKRKGQLSEDFKSYNKEISHLVKKPTKMEQIIMQLFNKYKDDRQIIRLLRFLFRIKTVKV